MTPMLTAAAHPASAVPLKFEPYCDRSESELCRGIRAVKQQMGDSHLIWGVGTELHLVNRLAEEHPDKRVHFLCPMLCMCATMYRIDLPHLAWCPEKERQEILRRLRKSDDPVDRLATPRVIPALSADPTEPLHATTG